MTATVEEAMSVDFGKRCQAVAVGTETAIRRDERRRVAALIRAEAATIGRAVTDPVEAVRLVAVLIEVAG